MDKLTYGSQKQIVFNNLQEFYFAMGFLANSQNAELRWENNEDQGAWGSEGRIHCLVPESQFPQFFRFTAGRGNMYARINCNEYVAALVIKHNFSYNCKQQSVEDIIKTVPPQYLECFQKGYGKKVNLTSISTIQTDQSSAVILPNSLNTDSHLAGTVVDSLEKSQPTPIELVIGDKVQHKSFGVGNVIEIKNNIIRVEFESVGEKLFINPDSFNNGYILAL